LLFHSRLTVQVNCVVVATVPLSITFSMLFQSNGKLSIVQ